MRRDDVVELLEEDQKLGKYIVFYCTLQKTKIVEIYLYNKYKSIVML